MVRPVHSASSPAEILNRLSTDDCLIEDFRPLSLNLEWRLSELHWIREGVTAFITGDVPWHVNNNGRASADAAAVLFANSIEAPADGGPLRVLELGAGSGLFARYFLDEFRDLCRRHGRDFYDRLTLLVTDRSPRTVAHWAACGLFADHGAHVETSLCDAASPTLDVSGPFRAVFANYVLDSLPTAVLRHADEGWRQLCVRASIRDEGGIPEALASRGVDWMRHVAAAAQSDDLAALLPLLPILETELAFLPIDEQGSPGWTRFAPETDAKHGAATVYNYGALRCLDLVLPRLDPEGFLLVRDYAPGQGAPGQGAPGHESESAFVGTQRFGDATAAPLDFALIERHARGLGMDVVSPAGDAMIHSRLFTGGSIPRTKETFRDRFGPESHDSWSLAARARELSETGLRREALDVYRQAIAAGPRDWQLLGEAARFAATQLGDPAAGLDLARAAIQLNPWYSPRLWTVLGDCLAALDRQDEAHDSYAEAHRLHPLHAEIHLKLAESWLRRGDATQSLVAVAAGLAADFDGMHRHTLLEVQQQAIDRLSRAATARREVTHRRRARQDTMASELRSEQANGGSTFRGK
jgi:tetratricopeptide (TPR) repeat protein